METKTGCTSYWTGCASLQLCTAYCDEPTTYELPPIYVCNQPSHRRASAARSAATCVVQPAADYTSSSNLALPSLLNFREDNYHTSGSAFFDYCITIQTQHQPLPKTNL